MVHSHQIKIATDWLPTGSRLVFDSRNWCDCNHATPMQPNCIYQSEASLKPVGSQSEVSLKPVGCKFNFGVNEPLGTKIDCSTSLLGVCKTLGTPLHSKYIWRSTIN